MSVRKPVTEAPQGADAPRRSAETRAAIAALQQKREMLTAELAKADLELALQEGNVISEVWPKRLEVACGVESFDPDVAAFAFNECGFSKASPEYTRMTNLGGESYLYFDVDADGAYRLVGAWANGVGVGQHDQEAE